MKIKVVAYDRFTPKTHGDIIEYESQSEFDLAVNHFENEVPFEHYTTEVEDMHDGSSLKLIEIAERYYGDLN